MRCILFSTKPYDQASFDAVAGQGHEVVYQMAGLTAATAPLAVGFAAVCIFVNDRADRAVLQMLASGGTRVLALRCAGFNHVDLVAAAEFGIAVVRVSAYSPHAIAEHAVGLLMMLNRRLHRAYNRVREGNFSLDGLLGFDVHGKTVGVIGTGRIGTVFCRIMAGFGCTVLAYDVTPNPEVIALGGRYASLHEVLAISDIVSLHAPLLPSTRHLIDAAAIARMKPGVMLINTSRGALVDTVAVIDGLKSGAIGALGLDVYEEEAELFFEDLSSTVIQDDVFSRLLTFPNVVITGHQAFLTKEALAAIASITLANLTCMEQQEPCANQVRAS